MPPTTTEPIAALNPFDEHNEQLKANVHPPDWVNPKPAGRYNLVVIGAGTAGLVTAAGAAGLGAKVAIVERALLGGDCLNVGCVPSKGVISAARAAAAVRDAGAFGVEVPDGVRVNFAAAMRRMRRLRASISPADSAKRFRDLGVDVFFGDARFEDDRTIAVDASRLSFKKAVIATGGRARAPSIKGLDGVEYLTNESVFSLTELPRRFGVIGGGPIGCELALALANFGSQVHLFASERGLLPKEDRDAAAVVRREFERRGIRIYNTARRLAVGKAAEGIRLVAEGDRAHDVVVDKLLVAAGRVANVENLNLEAAGVRYDANGVTVNDRLQTTNPRIYAAGDVCSRFKFTHAADFMARIVITNALFMGRAKASALTIPWCTYTSPEVAHVGLSQREAGERNVAIDTFTQELADVDRAVLDGETEGFVKVHVKKGTDRILGATIVAAHAGDMISEITLAMKHGIGLKKIGATIHPYPTQAEAIRKLGDAFHRTRLTPFVRSLSARWLAWTR
ncbi:MAG: mercuric reductase [Pirellulales bacterium]